MITFQKFLCGLRKVALSAPKQAINPFIGQEKVFGDRKFLIEPYLLVNHTDAKFQRIRDTEGTVIFPLKDQKAGRRFEDTVDEQTQRGFAGPMLADDGMDFGMGQLQVNVAQGPGLSIIETDIRQR